MYNMKKTQSIYITCFIVLLVVAGEKFTGGDAYPVKRICIELGSLDQFCAKQPCDKICLKKFGSLAVGLCASNSPIRCNCILPC
ncbi:hypothetical protein LINPERPRIM_LOCUS19363 [Linum perenne]